MPAGPHRSSLPEWSSRQSLRYAYLLIQNDTEYVIEPNNTYIFTIENDKNSYVFECELEPFFYVFNDNHILEAVDKEKKFKNKDKIYANYYVNITRKYTIKIKVNDDAIPILRIISFVALGVSIIIILIVVFIIFMKSKKKEVFEEYDEEDDKPDKNKALIQI